MKQVAFKALIGCLNFCGSITVKIKSLGILTAVCLSSVSTSALAQACTDTILGAGGTVTCSIVTTDTHTEFDAGVTINVLDTAQLNGLAAFSILNTGATINNGGLLNGSTTFLIGISDDVFVNTGTVNGTVAMVQGNDQFTNAAGGVVNGIVDVGSFGGVGNNTVTLQSGSTLSGSGQIFLTPAGIDVLTIEDGATFLGTANALGNAGSTANINADGVELSSLLGFGQINIDTSGTTTLNVASAIASDIDVNGGTFAVNSASALNGLVEVNGGTLDVNTGSTFGGSVTMTGGAVTINDASTIVGALNATGGLVSLGMDFVDANLAVDSVSIGVNARLEGLGDFGNFVTFDALIQIDGEIAPDLIPADITLIGNGNMVLSGTSLLDLTVGFGQDIGAAPGSEQALFASTLGSNNTTFLDGGALRISLTPASELIFGEFTVDTVSSFTSTTGIFGTIDTGDDFVLVGTSSSPFVSSVTLQSVFSNGPCAMTTPGDGGVIDCTASTNSDISIFNENVTMNIADGVTLGGTTLFALGVDSDDIVVNAGTIDGVVALIEGSDQFTNAAGGVIYGVVDLGSFGGVGDNTVTLESGSSVTSTGQIFLSQVGNDVLNIEEGATFSGTAIAAAGNPAGNAAATANIRADGVELSGLIGFGTINIDTAGTVLSNVAGTQLATINLQAGTLNISGGTTFAQGIDMSGGSINVDAGSLFSGPVAVAGGTFALNQGSTFADGLTIGAGGVFDQNAGATVNGPGVTVNDGGIIHLGSTDMGVNLETQSLQVAPGGMIMGRGFFGSFTPGLLADIVVDGIVAPDARSDATLLAPTFTALGNVTLSQSSELLVTFGGGLPGGGEQGEVGSSLLGVTGTTTLDGGTLTLQQVEGGEELIGVFELPVISSAGAISGEFGDVSVDGNFVVSDVDYLADSVIVTIRTLFGAGQTYSGDAEVLRGYVNSIVGSNSDGTRNVLGALVGLDPANGELEAALQQISPQPYASATGISRGLGFGIIESVTGNSNVRAVTKGAKTVWISGLYADSSQSSDVAGVSGFDSKSSGVLFGVDYAVNDRATLGGFAGYVDFDQRFDDIAATTDGDGFAVGAKGELNFSNLRLELIAGTVFGEAETHRTFDALDSAASAQFNIDTAFARAGVAYAITVNDSFTVTPHARLNILRSTIGEFEESTPDSVAFAADETATDFAYSDVGVTFSSLNPLWGGRLNPYLEVGNRYELLANEAVTEAGFVGEPTRFTVQGLQTDRNAVYAGAGAAVALTPSVSLRLEGRSVFGGDFDRQNVSLWLGGQF